MFAILGALLNAIVAFPSLYQFVSEAIAFLSQQIDEIEKKRKRDEYDAAAKKAADQKNTDDLENIFNPKH